MIYNYCLYVEPLPAFSTLTSVRIAHCANDGGI